MTLIKVCGVRTISDARMCVSHGVDAVGLNFWPGSKRQVEVAEAKRIVEAVDGEVAVVGLFVDERLERIEALRREVGFSWVQLHGAESPDFVQRLGPKAYKAIRVGDASIAAEAALHGGALLLLDAFVGGEVGGTGQTFDWRLAADLAKRRAIVLAGGLDAGNVADAIRAVRPRAVDVASGVEAAPGVKDERRVAAFVAAAHGAASASLATNR